MIQLSLNQIKTETIKAAKGINLEHGLADDLGDMSVYLAGCKINFTKDICYLLNKYSNLKYYPNIIEDKFLFTQSLNAAIRNCNQRRQ